MLRLADFGCAIAIDRVANPRGLIVDTVGTTAFWAPDCIQPDGEAAVTILLVNCLYC
jgi:hypothetical protein